MTFWRLQSLSRAGQFGVAWWRPKHTHTATHTPACTFLPRNPDTLPCFHAPPLPTTRGAKNRWQYDKKGWNKKRNRRKGREMESKRKPRAHQRWEEEEVEKDIQYSKNTTARRKGSCENEDGGRAWCTVTWLPSRGQLSPVSSLTYASSQLVNL